MDLYQIKKNYEIIKRIFPHNTKRKNYFLAACQWLDRNVMPQVVTIECPVGGIIGIGDSKLHDVLKYSKVLRLHAILHDAAGFMKDMYDVGPGYAYVTGKLPNWCMLGHVTGISYCIFLKLFSELYPDIDC